MITTSKNSQELLDHMFKLWLFNFVVEGKTIGKLNKQSKMKSCQEGIEEFIDEHPNSEFVIKDTTESGQSTMAIIISNITEKNDHAKRYIITIASSCETYKVERLLGSISSETKENFQVIYEFEKSKL